MCSVSRLAWIIRIFICLVASLIEQTAQQLDDSQHRSLGSKPTFQYERAVRWVDTDASGLAHFGSYVRMMEETEYAFLRSRGLRVVLSDDKGTMGFPRLSCEIGVNQPLVFDQQVIVQLRLVQLDGKQVGYEFAIHDAQVIGENEPAAIPLVTGKFVAAFCRFPDKQPPYAILMPEFVLDALGPALSRDE